MIFTVHFQKPLETYAEGRKHLGAHIPEKSIHAASKINITVLAILGYENWEKLSGTLVNIFLAKP
jgi:hypothetical protein